MIFGHAELAQLVTMGFSEEKAVTKRKERTVNMHTGRREVLSAHQSPPLPSAPGGARGPFGRLGGDGRARRAGGEAAGGRRGVVPTRVPARANPGDKAGDAITCNDARALNLDGRIDETEATGGRPTYERRVYGLDR